MADGYFPKMTSRRLSLWTWCPARRGFSSPELPCRPGRQVGAVTCRRGNDMKKQRARVFFSFFFFGSFGVPKTTRRFSFWGCLANHRQSQGSLKNRHTQRLCIAFRARSPSCRWTGVLSTQAHTHTHTPQARCRLRLDQIFQSCTLRVPPL